MTRRSPTLNEVARLAGVSPSAVSRTFTVGASVADKTRAKVLQAAELIGYRPNLLARSLSRQRSGTVGIAVTRLENSFNSLLLEELATALQRVGLGCRLIVTGDRDAVDVRIEEVLQHQIDVLVLCAVNLSSRIEEECAAVGVPVVMVNRITPGVGRSARAIAIVGSNEEGGRVVADHLAEAGHRSFAFIAGSADASNSREREAGFIAGLAKSGLPAPIVETGHYTFNGAMDATRTILGTVNRPDALFCANDHMALAAITVAQTEFGLSVGKDISIVGFDDSPAARFGAGLTSFSQPASLMAEEAARNIIALLGGNRTEDGLFVVPGSLKIRGSSRPANP
ncbi:LacI family DNA-binding transcriptional regulator [Sphingomonas parapaucimobilis]|uniref:LacI family DNA-binding transcriptional regulator n=1 Tax=Sphingomonas parapaucimobilis TaxID=28213 RepID=UPI00391D4D38